MKKALAVAGLGAALTAGSLLGIGPAHAESFVFDICPSGHDGVVGGHTSCPFADNVRQAYFASGGSSYVIAYSPITGERYEMFCHGNYAITFSNGRTVLATRCDGGDDATVVVW